MPGKPATSLAFLLCALMCAQGALAQTDRVAIMPMDDVTVESQVRNNVVNLNKYSVEPAQTTRDAVIAAKDLGIDCKGADAKCLAELGRLSGLSLILVADIKNNQISISSISVKNAAVIQTVKRDLGAPDVQVGNIRVAVLELLDPEALNGRAFIGTGNVAAEVFIDGKKVGTAPLAEPVPLSPGAHKIRITAEGYEPFENELQVGVGQDVQVQANLNKIPEPGAEGGLGIHPGYLIGSVVGGLILTAGVALFVGGVGYALSQESQLWHQRCWFDLEAISTDASCPRNLNTPENPDATTQVRTLATTSWVVGVTGLAVALTGLGVAATGITIGVVLDE